MPPRDPDNLWLALNVVDGWISTIGTRQLAAHVPYQHREKCLLGAKLATNTGHVEACMEAPHSS